MTRLLFFIFNIVIQFLSYAYVNAYKVGILGQELFNPYASQVVPVTAKVEAVEGKHIIIDLMDSLTLYKITTSLHFSDYDTISFEYYIENGKGQILLLQNNAEVIMHTVLDDLSTEKDKWISVTYKIPQCSNFDTIALKNIDNLKIRFRSIIVSNTKKIEYITSKLSSDVTSWSWGISDIINMDDYINVNEIGQWCALSVHYDKEAYYHDYVEFEAMQTELMMSFSVATDNCGDYDYMLYEITPEKKGDWYKYHIDFGNLIMPSCNINRFSFMNRKEEKQELSIKNLYTGSYPIDETLYANKDKEYECDELLSMVGFFNSEEEIDWTNLSEKIDHILYQPNRLVVYGVNPDGYISYKSPKEFQSPIVLEMEVLSSYSHWTFEIFDPSGNKLNNLSIDNDEFSMKKGWTTVKQVFEKETGKQDIMNSFKLYHNSTKNENIIIRSLNFHPYNPPIESGINSYESCCQVRYCVCEVIYETIYIDEDEEIPSDADVLIDLELDDDENNEDVNEDESKEDAIANENNEDESKENVNENENNEDESKENVNDNENNEDESKENINDNENNENENNENENNENENNENENNENENNENENNENENNENENNENENNENENNNNNNKEGDIQKRSLFNRIGSFLNSLNI